MKDYQKYTDKYFLRTKDILEKEDINPTVRMKIFTRKGSKFAGSGEVFKFLEETLLKEDPDAHLWSIPEISKYNPMQTLMVIEAKAQALVDKETVYLGMLSSNLTVMNGGLHLPTYEAAFEQAKRLVAIAGKTPLLYMGARHYHPMLDETIARACLDAGFGGASTDIGAATHGLDGLGTTPHFLSLICAYYYGFNKATSVAMAMFDRHMGPAIPRTMLVDTFNKEIDDSLATAEMVPNLKSIRLDTCGSNVSQGGEGEGVTLRSTVAIREALDNAGHKDVGIVLSSGFGKREKLQAFAISKEYHRCVAYGIGEVVPAIFATSDIYEIEGVKIAKVGREVGDIDLYKMKRLF